MASRIAAFDWASTAIGPIETWPQSLKAITGFLVQSPVPMVLLWGPAGHMIYNDAYSVFAGRRHPGLLGAEVREGWPEVADFNDNVMKVGLAGGTLAYKDQELVLDRHGRAEQAWMNLDYSPVLDDEGRPGGVIAIVVETTDRVLAERRSLAEREQFARLFEQAPTFMAMLSGPQHRFELANPGYLKLVGDRAILGRTVAEALPEAAAQGFIEMLDEVFRTGEAYSAIGAKWSLRGAPGGPAEDRYLDFVYQPITDSEGAVVGIFVEGADATERVTADLRREALVRLSERFRDAADPGDIAFGAAEILGELLGVGRVGYGDVDNHRASMRVERDWTAPDVASTAGVTGFHHYGPVLKHLREDGLIVIADVRDDARTAALADVLEANAARSIVNVGVFERGELVALLFVNDPRPRDWSESDIALIRDVAERTRISVERARGQAVLRESEARLRFLDSLGRETAKSLDADDILATTTRMVGEHLNIAICAYADMDEDQDGFTIRGDWAAPGSTSIVGHYSLADFGRLAVENLGAGLPLIVNDNLAELAPDEAATFQNIGIAATICMPLVKDGRLTALMAIHDKVPRVWTPYELATILEVTERSWAHIERARAEAELRTSEENFRTLARAMPNQVWTALPDGQLDWFNDQVYAYSGAKPGALDGANWTTIVHPDDLPHAAETWAAALESGATYETEFRLRRGDGTFRWHIARAVPILGERAEVLRWIGSNTDIEDQKHVAQALSDLNATLEERVQERTGQLMQAEEALRQSQKMEAVGQLTGGIAHDFNNLLAGIAGSLELLDKRIADGRLTGVERYIEVAQASTRRAAALTQRLLAFSRRQTLDPKPTDINRLVGGMEELIRRTAGPGVEVEAFGAEDLWLTQVDPSQLEGALLNLAINARDAMPEGGRVTIETANHHFDARAAKARELPPGQYVSLTVRDTGSGMTPDVAARAFDPFFTTKPLGQGTGLGLSMIHGFVRQSGGQVQIETEVGKGTAMRLFLPRFHGELDAVEPEDSDVHGDAGQGETVLVIDDEDAIRMLMAEVLEEAGYTVLTARDGAAGLKILQSDARVDLLITDVGLPGGINGRQVADAARIGRPDLDVLFVTGYAENAVVGSGRLDRGMQVITKPFAMTALAARVREIIEG